MLNLVLFGPPGSGKGTQAVNLAVTFNLTHLSTGDLLREEIASGTELGKAAADLMAKGNLVPDSIVIGMIEKKIGSRSESAGFIFDGFPRTVAQAVALDELLHKYGSGVTLMICLEVEKNELVRRLLLRGETSARPDDLDVNIIENRIKVYNEKTAPIIQYYAKTGVYRSIQGVGSIEEIAGKLIEMIEAVWNKQMN